ncbi:DUF6233 domain-containing protein [Streptomyces sp. NPDC001093]|uniref:DUF6233 domain-containing protein n=1 Tax=Streptomyces sp. NPDC001093 TaxID=3154376 RepID=UPI0033274B32
MRPAGGCWNAGGRSKGVDRSTALRALAEGVAACPHCRPDAELGVLSQRVSGGWAAQLSFVQRESRSSPVRWNRAPESFA